MPEFIVTVTAHGPYKVEGQFELVDREGRLFSRAEGEGAWLCRCGQSRDKPFCDGSHGSSGFRDPGAARELPGRPSVNVTPGAPSCVTVNPNGALRLGGSFDIVDEAGASYGLGGRTSLALCRCGASRNKPFCDGTHNTCGFRDGAEAG
jgi:CDGSH-type Zn-finger protein